MLVFAVCAIVDARSARALACRHAAELRFHDDHCRCAIAEHGDEMRCDCGRHTPDAGL